MRCMALVSSVGKDLSEGDSDSALPTLSLRYILKRSLQLCTLSIDSVFSLLLHSTDRGAPHAFAKYWSPSSTP